MTQSISPNSNAYNINTYDQSPSLKVAKSKPQRERSNTTTQPETHTGRTESPNLSQQASGPLNAKASKYLQDPLRQNFTTHKWVKVKADIQRLFNDLNSQAKQAYGIDPALLDDIVENLQVLREGVQCTVKSPAKEAALGDVGHLLKAFDELKELRKQRLPTFEEQQNTSEDSNSNVGRVKSGVVPVEPKALVNKAEKVWKGLVSNLDADLHVNEVIAYDRQYAREDSSLTTSQAAEAGRTEITPRGSSRSSMSTQPGDVTAGEKSPSGAVSSSHPSPSSMLSKSDAESVQSHGEQALAKAVTNLKEFPLISKENPKAAVHSLKKLGEAVQDIIDALEEPAHYSVALSKAGSKNIDASIEFLSTAFQGLKDLAFDQIDLKDQPNFLKHLGALATGLRKFQGFALAVTTRDESSGTIDKNARSKKLTELRTSLYENESTLKGIVDYAEKWNNTRHSRGELHARLNHAAYAIRLVSDKTSGLQTQQQVNVGSDDFLTDLLAKVEQISLENGARSYQVGSERAIPNFSDYLEEKIANPSGSNKPMGFRTPPETLKLKEMSKDLTNLLEHYRGGARSFDSPSWYKEVKAARLDSKQLSGDLVKSFTKSLAGKEPDSFSNQSSQFSPVKVNLDLLSLNLRSDGFRLVKAQRVQAHQKVFASEFEDQKVLRKTKQDYLSKTDEFKANRNIFKPHFKDKSSENVKRAVQQLQTAGCIAAREEVRQGFNPQLAATRFELSHQAVLLLNGLSSEHRSANNGRVSEVLDKLQSWGKQDQMEQVRASGVRSIFSLPSDAEIEFIERFKREVFDTDVIAKQHVSLSGLRPEYDRTLNQKTKSALENFGRENQKIYKTARESAQHSGSLWIPFNRSEKKQERVNIRLDAALKLADRQARPEDPAYQSVFGADLEGFKSVRQKFEDLYGNKATDGSILDLYGQIVKKIDSEPSTVKSLTWNEFKFLDRDDFRDMWGLAQKLHAFLDSDQGSLQGVDLSNVAANRQAAQFGKAVHVKDEMDTLTFLNSHLIQGVGTTLKDMGADQAFSNVLKVLGNLKVSAAEHRTFNKLSDLLGHKPTGPDALANLNKRIQNLEEAQNTLSELLGDPKMLDVASPEVNNFLNETNGFTADSAFPKTLEQDQRQMILQLSDAVIELTRLAFEHARDNLMATSDRPEQEKSVEAPRLSRIRI